MTDEPQTPRHSEREVLIAELKGKLSVLTPDELNIVVPGLEHLRKSYRDSIVFWDGDAHYVRRVDDNSQWFGPYEGLHEACCGAIELGLRIVEVKSTRGSSPPRPSKQLSDMDDNAAELKAKPL